MIRRVALIAILALSTPADIAFAQIVRGRVVDASTGAPVAGALVSLLGDVSDSAIVSLLTTESGEYGIRAAIPGSYRIAVKRIGVRRFVSDVFTLADGETRVIDVRIDPIAQELPQVTVSGMCATRSREIARISSLWDEARTALEATEISLRDQLMQARITRYVAELEPSNLQALFDWRSDAEVMVEQPFTSPSGDSLSALGYWRVLPGDSVVFLAPDARALSSDAFLRDHCFALTGAPRGRPGLVGLGFSPSRDRQQNDIAGTVWIDAKSYELRFIEFRYTGLRTDLPHANRVGGEVHFARLSSGAWIVDRWFIRMPVIQDMPPPVGTLRRLREEGGSVTVDGIATSRPMASLAGIFRDSANRPVANALIRAIGSHRQTRTGLDGGYRLDSLPIGGMSIVAHTGGYDAFALLAGSKRVELQAGRTVHADFRAPNAVALRSVACPPNAQFTQQPGQGALRVLLVDSATVAPMPGVQFLVAWQDPLTRYTTDDKKKSRTAITDNRGTATFCSLPAGVELELQLFGAEAAQSPIVTITLPRTGIVGRVITGKISR